MSKESRRSAGKRGNGFAAAARIQEVRNALVIEAGGGDENARGIDAAHDLAESKIEIAQLGFGRLSAGDTIMIVVRGYVQLFVRMPHCMRQRAMLRHKQQHDANELQKSALHFRQGIEGVRDYCAMTTASVRR